MSDQRYFGLVTNVGLTKLRAAAQGVPLLLSHVAFGDGGGVETAPSVSATALVNERYRGPVSDLRPHETNPGILYIEGVIPSGTGGWTLREVGVYDSAGDLIVIAKPPSMDIALIAEGASVEGLVRLPLVFESLETISLLVDPSIVIATQRWSIERLLSRAFLSVGSVSVAAPPAAPLQHDLYYVPANATGAWAGKAHHLAWYLGATWIFVAPRAGTILCAIDSGNYWRKTGSGLEEWKASVSRYGLVELATNTETQTGADAERAVTPAGLSARTATVDRTGIVELATVTEARAGADTERAVTPAGLRAAGDDIVGLIPTIASLDARYSRIVPPPATTFYVVGAGGSDSNTGLSTAAGFATIKGAIAAVNSRYSTDDVITLIVSAGTFAGFPVTLAGNRLWRIKGAGRTSTFINATSTTVNSGRACTVAGASVILEDLALSAYFECATVGPEGGMLEIVNCNFALGGAESIGISATAGQAAVYGSVRFSGSGRAAILSSGLVRLGYADAVNTRPLAIDWAAGASVAGGNLYATNGGVIELFRSAVTQTGAPTGRKYLARLNGIINTQGAAVDWLAGTLAGATETGGQYV